MAGQKRSFKVSRLDVEDYLAVAIATKDTEMEKAIRGFCPLFAIEYDENKVKELSARYTKVAESMAKKGKKTPETA